MRLRLYLGTSLAVQWLRHHASSWASVRSLVRELRSYSSSSLLLLLSEMGVLLSISRAGNAREQRLAEQHRAETERMLQRTRYRSRAAR